MIVEEGGGIKDADQSSLEHDVEGAVMELPLYALSEQLQRKTITLQGLFKDQLTHILVDIGSTTSFIDYRVAQRLNLPYTQAEAVNIILADGSIATCTIV